MTSSPLISVVIPTFNRPERTLQAIESALSQTLRPLEVVVVDDGSTDDTAQRIESRHGAAVRMIRLDRNRGGASARNAGASAARGEFVAFLDSDDLWLPHKLQMQYDCHARHVAGGGGPAIVYCSAGIDWEIQGRTRWPERGLGESERVADYLILAGQDMQTSGLFMPLSAFQAVRFREGLARHQDMDFVIRAQEAGMRFLYVDEALYLRRRDDSHRNTGRTRDDDISLDWIESIRPLVGRRAYHRFIWDRVMPHAAHRMPGRALRFALAAQFAGEPGLTSLLRIARREIRIRWGRLAARVKARGA